MLSTSDLTDAHSAAQAFMQTPYNAGPNYIRVKNHQQIINLFLF